MSSAAASMPVSGMPSRYLRQAPKNISRTSSRDGLNIVLRFLAVFAQVTDQTLRAAGLARKAYVAPMQDEPMVGVLQVLGRRELQKLVFYGNDVFSGSETGPVCDPEDVGIDRHRRLAERGVQHHVRGLAADAGQALERIAAARHLAAVLFQQDFGERDQVLRLGTEQADRLNVVLELGNAEVDDLLRRSREELARGEVHRLVGRLRRQHHRQEQLERSAVLELGGRIRIRPGEAGEDLPALRGIHLLLGLRTSARMRLRSSGLLAGMA